LAPKEEKSLQKSNEDVKKKSRNGFIAWDSICYEGLDKFMFHCDKCLNRLVNYVEK
jgi:hypothetical protein